MQIFKNVSMVIGSGISRDSGEFKHYTRMSRRGYLQASESTPLASPGAPTDSNLLVVVLQGSVAAIGPCMTLNVLTLCGSD